MLQTKLECLTKSEKNKMVLVNLLLTQTFNRPDVPILRLPMTALVALFGVTNAASS